ncbi:hypothetical protein [Mucilaginibacter arboris]|uniref:DUF1640 domain-containing protein n=1 Tax=Mucilaginibacter arboris TaxID=2682090 RepID=A0A7K1SV39_9SPHI|nr:hypothetical protein [Mucilaginibacter arboris]MVN21108.1 hypothetical protein [Mucilaginibacter arboris]
METKIEKQFDLKKDVLATKQDLSEVKTELKLLIAELRTDIANQKSEIIKWLFIFWVGQLAAMIAIAELIIKR